MNSQRRPKRAARRGPLAPRRNAKSAKQLAADGAQYRALASFSVNGGDVTIKDGKLVGNGQTTQWQNRCN